MDYPEHCDVLIVGAGPTGLMLANQLARRGVDIVIVDRNAGPSVHTKALGVHARSLEIYSHLGLASRAVQMGNPASGANLWTNARRMARIPLGDIGRDLSPFPFLLILGQDDNERLLGDALQKHGVSVHWNSELVGLEQGADDVVATLQQPNGATRTLRAGWVAGCDGPRSAVRELNQIDFPGAPYQHVFYVADTTATGPMRPDELNIFLSREGFHLFFPLRGRDHWRVVGILPAALRDRDDLEFDAVTPSVREHVGAGLAFQECRWLSTYRIHHRRAAKFRDRRCFLLGDAAHIHSPAGAQGMNTGLQDAYNLGWKLALVCAEQAAETLLDSYAAERVPVAERLLFTTDRAFSLAVSDSWVAGLLRARVVAYLAAFAMRFQFVRRLAFRTVSQIGIHYRGSPLSQTEPGLPVSAPRPGDRFPWMRLSLAEGAPTEDLYAQLDDTRFHLIVIGQTQPEKLGQHELISSHTIPLTTANRRELARTRIPNPSYFLLRPDGHVGLAGRFVTAETLHRYFSERLRAV